MDFNILSIWSILNVQFELVLMQYIYVVNPIIHALWCLEAASANPTNVFIFWHAVAAYLSDLFLKPTITGIPIKLANKIISVFNKRYQEFFMNEVYFTAFCLDPCTYEPFHLYFDCSNIEI